MLELLNFGVPAAESISNSVLFMIIIQSLQTFKYSCKYLMIIMCIYYKSFKIFEKYIRLTFFIIKETISMNLWNNEIKIMSIKKNFFRVHLQRLIIASKVVIEYSKIYCSYCFSIYLLLDNNSTFENDFFYFFRVSLPGLIILDSLRRVRIR